MEQLQLALDRLGHTLTEVVDVVCVQPSHRDTTIGGHVDVGLLSERLCLGLGQASEATQNVSIEFRNRRTPYLNMPIWDLMCPHSPGVLRSLRVV